MLVRSAPMYALLFEAKKLLPSVVANEPDRTKLFSKSPVLTLLPSKITLYSPIAELFSAWVGASTSDSSLTEKFQVLLS